MPIVVCSALQRIVVQIAIAAVELQGLVADLDARGGGEALGHRTVKASLRMAAVQSVGGQQCHLPAGGELGEHVGELELQGLELGRRLVRSGCLRHRLVPKQEMPLAPSSPVRAMTISTSVLPAPEMKHLLPCST